MIDQEKKVGDPKKLWGDGGVGRVFPRDKVFLSLLPSAPGTLLSGRSQPDTQARSSY